MNAIIRKPLTVTLLFVLMLTGGLATVAAGHKSTPMPTESRAYLHSYNLDSRGLALEGYCPVSYFTAGRAVKGMPQYASTYNDVDYHFASADAKRTFDRSPEKYIPAFGGWCAYGMAVEDKFPIDPFNFKIVDGRLMVFLRNRNVDALAKWNEGDERTQVAKAESHWAKVSR